MSGRTVDEWTEALGDDIAYWMGNPFLDADLRASKVAYWLNKAASLPGEQPAGERAWRHHDEIARLIADTPPSPALPGERADEEGQT